MASSSSLSHLLLLLLLSFSSPSLSTPHKPNHLRNFHHVPEPTPLSDNSPPSVFFEVTKPISVPKTHPCKYLVLQHVFGYTYGKPPVVGNYSFPHSGCGSHREFARIVLEWNATSIGRQFDRIFGVWLNGVELLRSCTAEPRPNGIFWSVQKDVTRYSSLLVRNGTQDFAVYLGNVVDSTYTGLYNVNVSVYFYPKDDELGGKDHGFGGSEADLILPISRNLPLNDGLWFEIENSTDVQSKEFVIPRIVYRAVLEVYVSFHENDEFWYANYPNEYIAANNLTDTPGNGPFREVVVSLDGATVGAIWPFTVIFTGGVNPLLWRPITGIGSFDLPSYDIEITPFLGNLLDGNTHKLGFGVTNALNVWYIDANLHLWLDPMSSKTEGEVITHESKPVDLLLISEGEGLNGTFLTSAKRSISSTGWVKSSYGKIITRFNQSFGYSNVMEMEKDGDLQKVKQMIHFEDVVTFRNQTNYHSSFRSLKDFRLNLYQDLVDQGNDGSLYITNVTLGFDEKYRKSSGSMQESSSLKNLQNAGAFMVIRDNLVQSGVGNTQQVYRFIGNDDSCYFRNVSSSNYTILYDKVGNPCSSKRESWLRAWWRILADEASDYLTEWLHFLTSFTSTRLLDDVHSSERLNEINAMLESIIRWGG